MPSRREGFPVSIAEAMASGLPCVTASFPDNGTAAVVEQYGCGRVAKPEIPAIADAMQGVIVDWERYYSNCRIAAASLEWSNLVAILFAEIGLARQ